MINEEKEYIIDYLNNKENSGLTYRGIADIVNDYYNTNYWTSERVRDVKRKYNKKHPKYEKIKEQTENLEYMRYVREQCRADLTEEKMVAAIKKTYHDYNAPKFAPVFNLNNERELIVGISDMHYGVEFEIKDLVGNIMNKYNPEIFEQRMWKLRDEIILYATKNNINKITIFNLGDDIEGILHINQIAMLRYGVIDSTMLFSNFMLSWVLSLADNTRFVINYKQIRGNHSDARIITGKKGDFPHENFSKVTSWFLETVIREKNIPNIFVQNYNDEGNIYCPVCGFDFLALHGGNESKDLTKSLKDYSFLYNKNNIDFLVAGHLHHGAYENCGLGKEVMRFPSIMGGNNYSIDHKKIADAGAKLFIIEKDIGITDEHRVKF